MAEDEREALPLARVRAFFGHVCGRYMTYAASLEDFYKVLDADSAFGWRVYTFGVFT